MARMPKLSKGIIRSKTPRLNRSFMPRVHRSLRSGRGVGNVGGMRRKLFRS